MAKKRCLWFEEESPPKDSFMIPEFDSGSESDSIKCPYSDKYLVTGTKRCIFHLPREHKEKAERFERGFEEVLSNKPVVWLDKNDKDKVEYFDLFGFVFPNKFPLIAVLGEHPPELPLCLVGADLQGADLYKARLQSANLSGAHLQGAYLYEADLQGADLSEADLQGADLSEADLQGADLSWAHLQGANFGWTHLQGTDFVWAHLQGADLGGAYLQGANFYCAHLQGVDFRGAHLQGADLSRAQLCADPTYRPGEEWDKWIEDCENNERAKYRLLRGKQRLTGGLDAVRMYSADLGAGQCKGENIIILTATENKYRERTYEKMKKHVGSRGIVTSIYNENNKGEIEAVELELTPAVLNNTDLRGVDLSNSTIAGADFTSARLDGTLLRGTRFGIKTPTGYDSRWHHKDRRGYSDKIKRNRVKLFNKYRRLKPKWLRSLLKPIIKRRVKSTMIRAELPIFEEANLEAADWADNRRAQRDFIYAEYVRQFKHHHPRIAKLWSITCDYGRTLKRWAAWSATFMILFGALFLASHLLHKADDNWFTRNVLPQVELQHELQKGQPTEFSYFYFSAVTFTTLGFGDVTPINLAGQIAVTIEVILGYVMLGGLISIFAVKLARRD